MTNHASKLLIKDATTNTYLVMYRAEHPIFGNSVDLPGGTVEKGESAVDAVVREVYEEAQVVIEPNTLIEWYDGRNYSRLNTRYTLFYAEVAVRPEVTISWEHSHFDWISKDQLVEESNASNDRFMKVVTDHLEKV